MRTRTPGLRWFDSEWDFTRRCDVVATHRAYVSYGRGQPVVEEPPRYSSVVDAVEALWTMKQTPSLDDTLRDLAK